MRLSLLSRLRGRGPFTVIPISRLSSEERLMIINTIREELVFALSEPSHLKDEMLLLESKILQEIMLPTDGKDKKAKKNPSMFVASTWHYPLWIAFVLILTIMVVYWFHDKYENEATSRNFRIVNSQTKGNHTITYIPFL